LSKAWSGGTKGGAVTDAEYQALARFRRSLRAFLYFSEEAAKEAGLKPAQYQLLLAIRGSAGGKPTIGEMADWLKLRHHSVVELVDRAELAGLIAREEDPEDRRRQRLVLTDEGCSKLEALATVHREELRRFREDGFGAIQTL
jgi:DNA-binding MarR family transcriptional regulator